jgi:hypothetical protein
VKVLSANDCVHHAGLRADRNPAIGAGALTHGGVTCGDYKAMRTS